MLKECVNALQRVIAGQFKVCFKDFCAEKYFIKYKCKHFQEMQYLLDQNAVFFFNSLHDLHWLMTALGALQGVCTC